MTILMNRNPGLPGHGSGLLQAPGIGGRTHEVRSSIALLVVGLVATAVLFLLLPFMQLVSTAATTASRKIPTFALPTPKEFVPPPPPPVKEKPAETKPELKQEIPHVPYESLIASVNPGGTEIPGWVIAAPTEGFIPEIFEYADLERRPVAIHTVAPDVPRSLSHVEGSVLLEFIVTPQGTVTAVKVVSSNHRGFEQSAIKAVEQWRFEPGLKDGNAVATRMRLPIRFTPGN